MNAMLAQRRHFAHALAAAGILFIMPGCITERTTSAPAPAASAGSVLATPPPKNANLQTKAVAAPAASSVSQSSAARVAVEPLAVIPYDGMNLPVISADGSLLLTMSSDGGPNLPARPVLYDLAATPPSIVPFDASSLAGRTLASTRDPSGFLFGGTRGDPAAARLNFATRAVELLAAPPPAVPPGLTNADWDRLRTIDPSLGRPEALASATVAPANIAGGDMPGVLVLSLARGRMVLIDPRTLAAVPLAPGSVSGCWAVDATTGGSGPAVLLTTRDGLVLQRLMRDASGWRAADPTRLLRDPWVPQATTNPNRPYILIGPGPKDRPEMLQIVGMRLVP
jgi:hypothetical protein